MIEARDVSVDIAGKPIVSGVDFHARAGEIAAIVGPNGSGKTTFLKALSGELAYTGRIALNGRDLCAMKPGETAVQRAVLPQATTLSFPFTVREVVKLGLVGGRSGVLPGWRASISTALPDVSTRSFRAASSSASSLRACYARSGHRCSTANRAISSSMSRFPASTSSTS
jgi:ABC-type hemin transport system ATPase subunit